MDKPSGLIPVNNTYEIDDLQKVRACWWSMVDWNTCNHIHPVYFEKSSGADVDWRQLLSGPLSQVSGTSKLMELLVHRVRHLIEDIGVWL